MSSIPDRKDTGLSTTRRQALVALAAIPLAACSSNDFTEYGAIGDAIKSEVGLQAQPSIGLEEAARVPYSSLGFQLGNGRESMLVLAEAIGDGLLWTASSRVSLLTRSGRIFRSSGFDWNLSSQRFLETDPVAIGLQHGRPQQLITRIADFDDISRYGIMVTSRFTSWGPDTIKILGQPLKTVAAVEACSCESIGWTFQNTFWADVDTGFVWKSVQNIHPNLDPITVEILRPPSA